MLICLHNNHHGNRCNAQNKNGAKYCRRCGHRLHLRSALPAHDPGTLVKGYRIIRMIGHGGFGAVYEAEDMRGVNGRVALKQTFKKDSDSTSHGRILRNSFEREFSVFEHLQHPNLPRYYDMFEAEGHAYLIMEFIESQDLKAVLQKTPGSLLEAQVLGCVVQLCDALSYLHKQDPPIIHRDIKPANILLTPEGVIKLVDFGLFKVGGKGTQSLLTGWSPPYAPPEQIYGGGAGETDQRSDLYSLGATLYHLLTNQVPVPALKRMVVSLDPLRPSQELNPNLSPHVAEAIMTAMALRADERYPDAITMKNALMGVPAPMAFIVSQTGGGGYRTIREAIQNAPLGWELPMTFIVSQTGGGGYRTISEAIQNAPPGSRILVQPGVYAESLLIDKHLVIMGDGPIEKIVVEGVDASCLRMQTERAQVRRLTLRGRVGAKKKKRYAVNISQGELLLEDCDISSDSLACVAIHGKDSNPIIRRCKIHHGEASGIFIYDHAQGTVEACEIFGNTLAGVVIIDGSKPLIRECKIYDGKANGVYLYDQGQGVVENCDIWGNAKAGVAIKKGSKPVIENCKIYENKEYGVLVYKEGQGSLKTSQIFANLGPGVEIRAGGNPFIKDCQIYNGHGNGVFVHSNGQGTLEKCDIFGNARAGVRIRQGSNPSLRLCNIHDGQQDGVFVDQNGQGTIDECEIYNNARAGVRIRQGGKPLLRDCKIYQGEDGVLVEKDGLGTLQRGQIFQNENGLRITSGGNPSIEDCQINGNKQQIVREGARG